MQDAAEIREFSAFCPLVKADGGMEDHEPPATVSGPAASENDDLQGELMERAGVCKGLTHWVNGYGAHVDYNHQYQRTQRPQFIIGRGEVFYVDNRPWIKTTLRKGNPWAKECFDAVRDKLHMGYSVLGDGVRKGNRIVSTIIKMVTIAPMPMGKDQFLQVGVPAGSLLAVAKALVDDLQLPGMDSAWKTVENLVIPEAEFLLPDDVAKAFTTGNDIVLPGDQGGSALRSQYLIGADGSEVPGAETSEAKKRKKRFLDTVTAKAGVSVGTAERIHKALCLGRTQG